MLAHDAAQCLGFQRVFGEVTPGKFDGAAVCPGLTGQDTYGRCLSGSVRSEIGHKFPIPPICLLYTSAASVSEMNAASSATAAADSANHTWFRQA